MSRDEQLPGCKSLMQDWCDAMAKLTRRLSNIGTFKPDEGKCALGSLHGRRLAGLQACSAVVLQ